MDKVKDKDLKNANGGYLKETETILRPGIGSHGRGIPPHYSKVDYYTFDIGDCFINGNDKYKVTSAFERVAWHIEIDCEHTDLSGTTSPKKVQALTLASYQFAGNNVW